jgi:ABC-type glycerol-3-phosphate transport system permease component
MATFRHITWPAILPVSVTIVLIRMIEGFKIVDMPNILTGGGPGTATQSLTLDAYLNWRDAEPRQLRGDRVHPAHPRDGHRVGLRRLDAALGAGVLMRNPLRRRSPLDLSPRAKLVSYVLLIAWSLVVLFPLYWLAVTSLKQPVQVDKGPFYIPFVDFQPTLDAWKNILVDLGNDTIRPYINTVIVGFTSAVICTVMGSAAAYALVRFDYRPRVGLIVVAGFTAVGGYAAILAGVPWPVAIASGVAVFLLLAQTIGPAVPTDARQRRHRVLADFAADPAADRGRRPAVRPLPADRPARHAAGARPDLHRDEPADRRLADARLLRGAADRARGGGVGRRRVGLPDRPVRGPADRRAGARGDRS